MNGKKSYTSSFTKMQSDNELKIYYRSMYLLLCNCTFYMIATFHQHFSNFSNILSFQNISYIITGDMFSKVIQWIHHNTCWDMMTKFTKKIIENNNKENYSILFLQIFCVSFFLSRLQTLRMRYHSKTINSYLRSISWWWWLCLKICLLFLMLVDTLDYIQFSRCIKNLLMLNI